MTSKTLGYIIEMDFMMNIHMYVSNMLKSLFVQIKGEMIEACGSMLTLEDQVTCLEELIYDQANIARLHTCPLQYKTRAYLICDGPSIGSLQFKNNCYQSRASNWIVFSIGISILMSKLNSLWQE